MRAIALPAAAIALALPLPAIAQDAAEDAPLAEMSRVLSDRETQQRLAATVEVLAQALLDMPLAPLAEAAAKAGGRDPETVDPDMTVRKMAPDAERATEEISEELPEAMDRLATMTGALETMLPALQDMAERMKDTLETARER